MLNSYISGIGHYLPEKVVTNDDLAKIIDTTDEWIRERTGISERRYAAEGEGRARAVLAQLRRHGRGDPGLLAHARLRALHLRGRGGRCRRQW